MKLKISIKNTLIYAIGIFILSFSVVLSFRTGFGVTPADNLTGILSSATGITLGLAAFIVSSFFILILLGYFRNWKFLFLFVQVFLFAPLLDFWDLIVLSEFSVTGTQAIFVFALSLFLLPLGGVFMILSTYPAGLYDELMYLTYRLTKLKINVARTLNELVLVGISLTFSHLLGTGFGTVGYGTLLYAISIGTLVRFYLFVYDTITKRR